MIQFTAKGMYCSIGDFYIDPIHPVKNAVITHAHGDHIISGCTNYLSTPTSRALIKLRLGSHINISALEYGESKNINGLNLSFHPAGHIAGSAQIRLEYKGEIWVCSGDYKLEDDGISTPFEPIRCHTFITESTFGLPEFKWEKQQLVFESINQWWRKNQAEGRTSILTAYALGKAQRILRHIDHEIGPIIVHGAVENIHRVLRKHGYPLNPFPVLKPTTKPDIGLSSSLVVIPPGLVSQSLLHRFPSASLAKASGWVAPREGTKDGTAFSGFPLSDHSDFEGLVNAVKWTGAEDVFVMHGYTREFSSHLKQLGYRATPISSENARNEDDE